MHFDVTGVVHEEGGVSSSSLSSSATVTVTSAEQRRVCGKRMPKIVASPSSVNVCEEDTFVFHGPGEPLPTVPTSGSWPVHLVQLRPGAVMAAVSVTVPGPERFDGSALRVQLRAGGVQSAVA